MEFKSSNSNNFSAFLDHKPKGKVSTFASSPSKSILKFDNIQQSLEMLKISLKKESDRRNKLRKLLQKYSSIYIQEKKHVKQIKSSIIEMKDTNATPKFRILIDPTILVENQIKTETRQFLCALMNTFYQTYQQNQKNNQAINNLNGTMAFLIKGISYSEDMLFLMQKSQINQQVQLEGQLLTQKNKLKQQILKRKEIKEQHNSVHEVYKQGKTKNDNKKKIINDLKKKLDELCQKSQKLNKAIQEKQAIKMQCQDKIDTEIMYQQKLNSEVSKISEEIVVKKKESKKMLKQLFEGKVKEKQIQLNANATCRKNRTLGQQRKSKMKFELLYEYEHLRG